MRHGDQFCVTRWSLGFITSAYYYYWEFAEGIAEGSGEE